MWFWYLHLSTRYSLFFQVIVPYVDEFLQVVYFISQFCSRDQNLIRSMSPLTWKTFTLDLQISPLTLHLIRVTLKILLIYWICIDYLIPCRDGPKARSGEPWPSWFFFFFFFYNLSMLYIHYIFKFKSKIIILSPLKKKIKS